MLENIWKGEESKNNETMMRFHTTKFSRIEDSKVEVLKKFKNISNGDHSLTGQVIGCGEISHYKLCIIHYKKIDENKKCQKCAVKVEDEHTVSDYKVEMYVKVIGKHTYEEELKVKEIIVFKRVLADLLEDYKEVDIERKIHILTDKNVKIDYNIDKSEKSIAVSVSVIDKK